MLLRPFFALHAPGLCVACPQSRTPDKGRGKWFPGRITSVQPVLQEYDIQFDDGDSERNVPQERIRTLSRSPAPQQSSSPRALDRSEVRRPRSPYERDREREREREMERELGRENDREPRHSFERPRRRDSLRVRVLRTGSMMLLSRVNHSRCPLPRGLRLSEGHLSCLKRSSMWV